MVILFVNRFRKDLKNAPREIQKKVFGVSKNWRLVRIWSLQGSTAEEWKDRKATNIITGFVSEIGEQALNMFTPT